AIEGRIADQFAATDRGIVRRERPALRRVADETESSRISRDVHFTAKTARRELLERVAHDDEAVVRERNLAIGHQGAREDAFGSERACSEDTRGDLLGTRRLCCF